MSIYNGPSEQQFIELKRKVDAQFDQILSLRSDIQTMIELLKMAVFLLDKLVHESDNSKPKEHRKGAQNDCKKS